MVTSTKETSWGFPQDLGMYLAPCVIGLMLATRPVFLFLLASVLAVTGVIMLFLARLPLYRQHRFFAFGPAALDEKHRRLYKRAYKFLACSAAILLLLNWIVRTRVGPW